MHSRRADENRQRTLDAGIPLAVARLLAIMLECDGAPEQAPVTPPRRLSLDEIKFVRAATGAFLNSSLKFGTQGPNELASDSES